MATLRRGLPRTHGGEAWPPAGAVAVGAAGAVAVAVVPEGESPAEVVEGAVEVVDRAPAVVDRAPAAFALNAPGAASGSALRRGLPRVAGGDAWPPAGSVAVDAAQVVAAATGIPAPEAERAPEAAALTEPTRISTASPKPDADARESGGVAPSASDGVPLRRGLPRVADGDPWPPAGTVSRVVATVSEVDAAEYAGPESPLVLAEEGLRPQPAPAPSPSISAEGPVQGLRSGHSAEIDGLAGTGTGDGLAGTGPRAPLPFTRTVWRGVAPQHAPVPHADPRRPAWPLAVSGLFAAAGLAILAAAAILFVRAFLSLPFMQDFLTAYPGEYHPALSAPVGLPAWVGWQHFFNIFLMTLIIRSGLQVRRQKRPTVFWTPRNNKKGKISLTLWFHQALDLLWIVNGAVFIVLLFVTGQWIRIVPTSWDVFPNALSAALQYVSFDWPTENGWVNYNSLQQLAYFTIVFLAAPVAIATGFRMSGLWPKKATGLSKAYPIEWARAVHFPTMLFFSLFIVAHVSLVLLTGMLRNLNHMFAAQDAAGWTGFWIFVLSLGVIAAGWIAARPLVLAPIAKQFGNVSGR